ncbi:hypothetical protein N2152v2_006812 [Parachlorella kessleri]
MQRAVHQEELPLPWATDDKAWQQAADDVYKALARNGCLTLQLQSGARHLAALQTAYASVRDIFEAQPVEAKAPSAPGAAADVGCKDLGYKQVLTYKSGPWQANTISVEQHITLQKAMAAGQDLCASVLSCVAGSRAVRLPTGSFQGILESLPVSTQQWSSSLLHAFSYRPATPPEKATDATPASKTVAMPAEGPCAAHVDRSLLTLVYAPGQTCLQVMDGYGQWQAVEPLGEDQVLLMPGHALEYALCGLLPAAQHRVVAPPTGQASRCSMTFKLLPAPAAQVDFSQALDAAGHAILAHRYPPVSGAALMANFSLTHPSVNALTAGGTPAAAALGRRASLPALLTSADTARVQPAAVGAHAAAGGHDASSQRPSKRHRQAAADLYGARAALDSELLQLELQQQAAQNDATAPQPQPAAPAGQPVEEPCGLSGSCIKGTAGSSHESTFTRRNPGPGATSEAAGRTAAAADDRQQTDAEEDTITLRGIDPSQLRLITPKDGRANPNLTPADYELEDGDQLHAFLEQRGD